MKTILVFNPARDFALVRRLFPALVLPLFVALAVKPDFARAAAAHDCTPMIGQAVNSKTDAKAFTENYEFDCKESGDASTVRVHFDDPTGKIVVEETAHFLARPYLPETSFHDLRDDYSYKIRPLAAPSTDVEIVEKTSGAAEPKTYTISGDPELMTYLGAMKFIGDNVARLLQGEVLKAKLVVPSRHDAYSVRFRAETVKLAGEEKLLVHVELVNPLFRLFAPEIRMTYDPTTHQLLVFKGNAPILDDNEKPIPVEIKYRKASASSGLGTATDGAAAIPPRAPVAPPAGPAAPASPATGASARPTAHE